MRVTRKRLRPATAERRNAIREAAAQVFLREGFAASIDSIASEAKVSRRTVFNLFGSKNALFSAVLSNLLAKKVDATALDSAVDIETALRRFADNYVRVALSDDMIKMTRLIYAEYPRFPELFAELTTDFTVQMHPPLVAYLSRKMKAGAIVRLDCEIAAEQFLTSVLGRERDRIALGGAPASPAKLRLYLDQVVHHFVHGMSPPASGEPPTPSPGDLTPS